MRIGEKDTLAAVATVVPEEEEAAGPEANGSEKS